MIGMSHFQWTVVALVIGILAASCSSDSTDTDEPTATPSTTNSTAPPSTTTTVPPTTTTVPPTTTTVPEEMASVVVEYEDGDGWQYRVSVFPEDSDPNASPGGCVLVAAPGQTNMVFRLEFEGLVTDRETPIPSIVAESNIINDGTVLKDTEPFNLGKEGLRVAEEILPNAPGTKCTIAGNIFDDAGNIPPGEPSIHRLTIGPVSEESVQDVTVGLRFWTESGQYFDAFFTVDPDSGSVVR